MHVMTELEGAYDSLPSIEISLIPDTVIFLSRMCTPLTNISVVLLVTYMLQLQASCERVRQELSTVLLQKSRSVIDGIIV